VDELTADKEQKADYEKSGRGILTEDGQTTILATAWHNILGRLNSTSISLQAPTVSLNMATGLMASLVDRRY